MQRAKCWQVCYETLGQIKHVSSKLKTDQTSAERLGASYSTLQDYNHNILKGDTERHAEVVSRSNLSPEFDYVTW